MPDAFTYSFAGLTATAAASPPGPLPEPPPGFRVLRVRTRLPAGTYDRAVEALLAWRMHRATPLLRVEAAGPAAPGVRVELRAGPLRAPCEVVWALREPDRAGFAYGTLPGHPECGEEAFVVRRLADGTAGFTVTAVSRPAARCLRAAGPLGRGAQRLAAREYGRALRRVSAAAGK